jgi:hypothetical protein
VNCLEVVCGIFLELELEKPQMFNNWNFFGIFCEIFRRYFKEFSTKLSKVSTEKTLKISYSSFQQNLKNLK